MNNTRGQLRREADGQPLKIGIRPPRFDPADRVDVSLHEMAAEAAVGAKRPLEVDEAADVDQTERRHPGRLGSDVGANLVSLDPSHGKTDAVYRHAVARLELACERRRDTNPTSSGGRRPLDEVPDAFNEAREHILRSIHRGPESRPGD